MDLLSSVVSSVVVEVGKFLYTCIYPKIENTVHFSSRIENVRNEMEKLTKFRDAIREKVEAAEKEGYQPKSDVLKWLEDVDKLESEWESMQESIAAAKKLAYKCLPNCSLRSEVSTRALNKRDQLSRLIEIGEKFGSNSVVDDYQIKRVEFIPGPSIEGQSAATRNLNKILQLLEDDEVCTIGVWGMGGVGKTTLVKNLNNELLKSTKLSFGVVVWVTVPKPTDIRKVQAQIAKRLKLKVENEDGLESIASKIHQRLKEEKCFLLILDDVWEAINLDNVGVPQPEDRSARSKVILTSRFLDVCRQMRTDTEMKVYTLDEEESWQMFVKNAGDDAKLKHIQPLAEEIARECDGLPLAVTVIGASMRGKKRVELWKDALASLKMSEPHNKDVKDKVYKVIKWSFDSLESPDDIELSSEQHRSKSVDKIRRGDIQSCFLYCSLYPMAVSTEDLIHCWWAEGFLGEHSTYDEVYDRGITMIESLKDACLLETQKLDSVKMHDVVRDVAIWIAKSLGDEHNSLIRAGIGLADISHIKISASVKRISFVSNKIERLPIMECPETTTLLLQDNPLRSIPRELLLTFPALKVLNLSGTRIESLPSSINSLHQLHALILQNCWFLKELPPIGNLGNLQLLDCAYTRLHRLPQGMDKLTDLRLLILPATNLESISQGILVKLSSIEMINLLDRETDFQKLRLSFLRSTYFDELSSLHKLTSLYIRLDSSSIFNNWDTTWMARLKRFHIEVGEAQLKENYKSRRTIRVSKCEIFSKGELSGMLQFASDLKLVSCMGLRGLIAHNSFDGLKALYIKDCYCNFRPREAGSVQFDPLPNLEHLSVEWIVSLKSISDLGHLLGLRFSKLRQLEVYRCNELACLFNVGGVFSVPKHLEEITIDNCDMLEKLFAQWSGSSQTKPLVTSEIPKVRKLSLRSLPKFGNLGETSWEHLEELTLKNVLYYMVKLPLSIQTSKNIKVIRGSPEWWSQLWWDDDNCKSNLEHCFLPNVTD